MANNWNVNSKLLEGCALYVIFSTFAARRLRLKSSSLHMSLCGNISIDDCSRELFKPSKDSASLWICNEKNFGFWILCEWRHKWSSFGPFWSISSGHRHKPRDGSFSLNTLALGCFWGFSKKKHLNARGFSREYLRSCMGYEPGRSVKRCGKCSSLHSKKNFLLGGCGFFVSNVINGGLLGHLAHFAWPWVPTVRWWYFAEVFIGN